MSEAHRIVKANGNVVLTERLDMIRTPTGIQGLPVMGTFVVSGGKTSRWHDYWDAGLPLKMMTGEDLALFIPLAY